MGSSALSNCTAKVPNSGRNVASGAIDSEFDFRFLILAEEMLLLPFVGFLADVEDSRGDDMPPPRAAPVRVFAVQELRLGAQMVLGQPEFWGEVQPPASLKGLDIPSRRAVFVPWKPSRRPVFGMGNPTFR